MSVSEGGNGYRDVAMLRVGKLHAAYISRCSLELKFKRKDNRLRGMVELRLLRWMFDG